MSHSAQIELQGRRLKLSNLDKVLYPKAGFTKAQVIDYYARIAPFVLPHLADRPLTLKRYPNGVEGQYFYEKRCPPHRPDWVKTAKVYSHGRGADIQFCLANDLPTLVWAANLADLELHPYLHRFDAQDRPLVMAFDLDPGPPADVVDCSHLALELRALFEDLDLALYPKTSGSKGLQLYLPLNTDLSYDDTKAFSRAVAEHLARRFPGQVVSKMAKALRGGKVLVDWSQNDEHKTTVAPYSLRAKERPTVSTPVTWQEVERAAKVGDPALLVFEQHQVLERVERLGDLWAPVLTKKQRLPRAGVEALAERGAARS